MVEHLLAKERVASSNLVFRSRGDVAKWIRRGSAKPLFTGSNPVVASYAPHHYIKVQINDALSRKDARHFSSLPQSQ